MKWILIIQNTEFDKFESYDPEIELQEEHFDANKIYELDQLVGNFEVKGYEIVKHRASFKNKISSDLPNDFPWRESQFEEKNR